MFVLYEGPSLLDGTPIVACLTGADGSSRNVKTGGIAQTWILLAGASPIDAAYDGRDAAICGDCPHRASPGRPRGCYVNLAWAPRNIWKAYRAGRGLRVLPPVLPAVRLGAYGDPAAVPVDVWRDLVEIAGGHVGYTHQWRVFPELRDLCMASVESAGEAIEAHAAGWRTFRTCFPRQDPGLLPQEVGCPAARENRHATTCARCGLCSGVRETPRKSIVINFHGTARPQPFQASLLTLLDTCQRSG